MAASGPGAPRERRAELRPESKTREARCSRRRRRGAVRVRLRPDARELGGGRRPARWRRQRRDGACRGTSRRMARPRKDRFRASGGCGGTHPAVLPQGRARGRALVAARPVRHRRRGRRLRAADANANGRGHRTRDERGDARQVAPSAAIRQGRDRGRADDSALGIRGPRAALPPAVRRPRRASGGAGIVRGSLAARHGHSLVPRRARLPRSRDAGAAAAVRRRDGAAVHDAPQRARHAALPPHRGRALSQAPRGGRLRSRVRSRPRLPERGDRSHAQPRVHDAGVLSGLRRLRGDDGRRGGAHHARGRRGACGAGSGRSGTGAHSTISAHRLGGLAERRARPRRHGVQRRGAPTRGPRPQRAARRLDEPTQTARRAVRSARREHDRHAHIRRRLSGGALAAGEAEAGKSRADRAVRAVRPREGAGECLQRAERPTRSTQAIRVAGTTA